MVSLLVGKDLTMFFEWPAGTYKWFHPLIQLTTCNLFSTSSHKQTRTFKFFFSGIHVYKWGFFPDQVLKCWWILMLKTIMHCSVVVYFFFRGEPFDRGLVHSIESVIIEWTHQIQSVLKRNSAQPLLEGHNPGPLVELDFWKARTANLECIFEQVSYDNINYKKIWYIICLRRYLCTVALFKFSVIT